MKSLNIIQKVFKAAKILSEIAFVFAFIGFCASIVGVLSIAFGADSVIKIGGVTVHGIISQNLGVDVKSIAASLCGASILCAGIGITAKFSKAYFKNELNAGTPFTFEGAKEALRLGIITIALPTGCGVAGSIINSIVAGYFNVEKSGAFSAFYNDEVSVAVGVMIIVMSLLCRYGAELKESKQ